MPTFDRLVDSSAPTSDADTPSSSSFHRGEEAARRYAVGDVLDTRYTIVEEIGIGGMGVVYKALDRKLEKPVALKLMRPKAMDAANVARFRRELALARNVSHSNVCRVHDLGEVEGVLFISMEHVEGQRLDHLIVSMGRLSARQTVALGRQLCAGLRAVHEQGIVHRDLKPSNVMVNRSGHVFIMDFGLAIRPGGDTNKVTSTGAVLGTFAYLSPEQARGMEVGPRSDIYAAGLILYEMLTGVMPPGDEVTLPLALRDARERCPPPSSFAADVPPELDAIVMRCLERDPGRRFGAVEELEAALVALHAESEAFSSRTLSRRSSMRRLFARQPPARRWTAGAVAAVAVVLAAIGVRVGLSRLSPATGPPPVVAVLPLTNLSPDPSFAHLGVGIADVLVARLAAAPRLTIVSAEPSAHDTATDIKAIAKELGVSHIVSGTVQAVGGRVRVALTLLRARDAVVMSVGEDEVPLTEIFQLQAEMAEKLTAALDVDLSRDDRTKLARPITVSLDAFSRYSEAKALLRASASRGGADKALELLQEAIRLDPRFALAHAALGEAYLAKFAETKDPVWPVRATGPILQALTLDPGQPSVRLTHAMALRAIGSRDQALEQTEQILAQYPNDDAALRLQARLLAEKSRIDDAVAAMNKAIALRPDYWEHRFSLGNMLLVAQRLDAAAAAAKEAIRLRPDGERGYRLLGIIYQESDQLPLALETYQRALEIAPSAPVYSNIGTIRYWQGDYAAAAQSYQKAVDLTPGEPLAQMNLARAEERLASGNPRRLYAQALELLNKLLSLKADDERYRGFPAICEMKLGRIDRAMESIEAAMRLVPNDHQLMYKAAVIYAAGGRREEALSFLSRALDAGLRANRVERGDGLEALKERPEFHALLEKARESEMKASRSGS
jgi:eukaryotic-like serine/threonine-protein kinase